MRALMDELGEAAGLSPAVLAPVLKTVGIAILTHISAEVCRDAKESGIAAFVETAGAAVACAWPFRCCGRCWTPVTGLL
ncbi:MAG: SpoIIIAC/SpoIIIAD family protein [Dysosmobacter welbionis]